MSAVAYWLSATAAAASNSPPISPPSSPPISVGRDEARELAEAELADPIYAEARPGLVQRFVEWFIEQLEEFLAGAAGSALAGPVWLYVLGALLVAGVVVLIARAGAPARTLAQPFDPIFDDVSSAAELRQGAAKAMQQQDWNLAVTQAFRAAVRQAEERDLLHHRPGRTADEAASELSAVAGPGFSEPTSPQRCAEIFDAVRFGSHQATRLDAEASLSLDSELSRFRPSAQIPADAHQ